MGKAGRYLVWGTLSVVFAIMSISCAVRALIFVMGVAAVVSEGNVEGALVMGVMAAGLALFTWLWARAARWSWRKIGAAVVTPVSQSGV